MFAFKLASHLGKSIDEILSMPMDTFRLWQAYNEIDPIGGYRLDLNFAMLAYLQAGDKDKSLNDFMVIDPNPITDDEREEYQKEQLANEARQEVAQMIALFNG